jgi:membrane protein
VLESLKQSAHDLPVVGTAIRALERGSHDYAKDMAASAAYFSFFSLFPFLIGVVACASFFFDPAEVQSRMNQLFVDEFPASSDFLRENLTTLIRLRGAAGFASVLVLLWSASKMSGALSRGIHRALHTTRNQPVLLSPLRNFGMTLGMSGLLFLAVAGSMALDFVPKLGAPWATAVAASAASYLFVFVVVALLYKWVPYQRPSWREVAPAALIAGLVFELGKSLFVFYIENVGHLRAVYGSLFSIVILLLWLYVSARVLLFGAELIVVRREQCADSQHQ